MIKWLFATLTIHTYFISIAHSALVVSVSNLISTSQYQCIKSNGYTIANVKGYCANTGVDRDAQQTLINAKSIGFQTHTYMFPCQNVDVTFQISQMFLRLPNNLYNKVWLSVETTLGPNCYWSKDYLANCEFLVKLEKQIRKYGVKTGIGSSPQTWKLIFGAVTACKQASEQSDLWYGGTQQPNFSDFVPFGGWAKAAMKTFNNKYICGSPTWIAYLNYS